eukprot:768728-Hanusia_phi.AAC.12
MITHAPTQNLLSAPGQEKIDKFDGQDADSIDLLLSEKNVRCKDLEDCIWYQSTCRSPRTPDERREEEQEEQEEQEEPLLAFCEKETYERLSPSLINDAAGNRQDRRTSVKKAGDKCSCEGMRRGEERRGEERRGEARRGEQSRVKKSAFKSSLESKSVQDRRETQG